MKETKKTPIENSMKYIASSVYERIIMWDFQKQQNDFNFRWTDAGIGTEHLTWEELPAKTKKYIYYDFLIFSGISKMVCDLKRIDYSPEFFKKNKESKFIVSKQKIQNLINETRINFDKEHIPYLIAFFSSSADLVFYNLLEADLESDVRAVQKDDSNNFSTTEKKYKEVYLFDINQGTKYKLENYNNEKTIKRTLNHCYKKTGIKEYENINIHKPR